MEKLFLHFLNGSLGAVPLVLGILAARVLLRRGPRWILCLLWALVALRLLCPALPQSPLGLADPKPVISVEYGEGWASIVQEEGDPSQTAADPVITRASGPDLLQLGSWLWTIGAAGMLCWMVSSWLRLRRRVEEAVMEEKGIYLCDQIRTPFILGLFRPRIYLPPDLSSEEKAHVLAHERGHLARRDHWWKPLGFVLLSLTWFNPVMWLAYSLLCRDMELACDEKVASTLDNRGKKAYSRTLMACSGGRRSVLVCPLAFGEVAVKTRVKKILAYRKPGLWLAAAALALTAVLGICFLTTGPQEAEVPPAQNQTIPTEPLSRAPDSTRSREIYTGSFSHGFRQRENVYSGGQMCLEYDLNATGDLAEMEMGLLLLLDGQPQPYRLSEEGELGYMHRFRGTSRLTIWFTPITGGAGDTLELASFHILEPDYRNRGNLIPFAITGNALYATSRLTMETDPGTAELPYTNRILAQGITGWEPPHEPREETFLEVHVYPNGEGGQVQVNVTAGGPAGGQWTVTVYADHMPVASRSLEFQGEGNLAHLEYLLDLSDFTGDGVIYAVLSARNWRDMEELPLALTISRTFYLKEE